METICAIDWRLRPPFRSFKQAKCFNDDFFRAYYPPSAKECSMQMLIKEMDAAAVQIGVVPFRIGQDMNDIARLIEEYGDRFRAFAYITPYAENPLEDIDKLVLHGWATGVIVEPGQFFMKRPIPANNRLMYPIYQKCEENQIVLTITFGGLYCAALKYYNPVFLDQVAIDFPQLKIVVGHGGWPYTTETCHIAYQRDNVFLAPDAYMFPIHPGYEAYVTAANHFLQKKFVFASCYPSNSLKRARELFWQAGIQQNVAEDILWNNAAVLLGVE